MIYKFYGGIHPFRNLLRSHTCIQKTSANSLHLLSHFDHMPVRIIKAHDSLSPGVFDCRMNILQKIQFLCFLDKCIKIIFLKINLRIIGTIRYWFSGELLPAFLGLQRQAACQHSIGTQIRNSAQPQNLAVKFFGALDILYNKQRVLHFHMAGTAVTHTVCGSVRLQKSDAAGGQQLIFTVPKLE